MIENDPSGRVQVVGRGDLLHPGTCMLCGSGNCDDGYVNLGVYYDYEGQMYLCMTCAMQTAEVVGCVLPKEADMLRGFVNSVEAENTSLKAQLEAANERLNHIDAAFSNVLGITGAGSFTGDLIVEVEQGSNELASEPVKSASDREPEVTEPVVSSRQHEHAGGSRVFDLG